MGARIQVWIIMAVLVGCGLFAVSGQVLAHEDQPIFSGTQLKIAIAEDYPPFTMINSEGRPAGLVVDLWRQWSKKTGVPVEFIASDWSGTLDAVRNHEADVHSGLFWTPRRSEWLVLSDPIYTVRTRIFARADYQGALTPDALSEKTIGVIKGTAQVEFLSERIPGIELKMFDSPLAQIRAVIRGDVDLMVSEELPVRFILAREGLAGELREAEEPIFVNALFGGISRAHAGMLGPINKGLSAIRREELMELERTWVPTPSNRQFGEQGSLPVLTAREQTWIAENPVVQIGIDPAWPPFEFLDKNGSHSGIASEYMALIEERTGLKLEVAEALTWEQVIEAAKSQRIDALSLAAPTPDRETYLRFTRPYLSFPMVVVMRADAPFVSGIRDLQGMPVAVARNYVSHELLAANHPELSLVLVTTAKEGLIRVSDSRAAAYVGNLASVTYVIRQQGLTNLKIAATTPYRFDLGMGVRQDWPVLHGILEKTLAGISRADQEAIHGRWITPLRFEHGVDRETLSTWLLRGTFALAVILGGIFLWNWRLQKEIQERRLVEAKLRALATTDSLTGIANRRHFYDLGDREVARMRRAGHPVSLAMIDIDHFKNINDEHGHIAGDTALKALVKACQPCLRNSDIFGRLGGEEFAVLLPDTTLRAAEQVAERLRAAAEAMAVECDGEIIQVTISLGVAQAIAPSESFDSLVRRADQSLYDAKGAGRNRVQSSPPCGAVSPSGMTDVKAIKTNVQALPSKNPFS